MKSSRINIIADFSVTPIGLGATSFGKYVAEAVNAIKKIEGIRCEVTAMGTILESEKLETILEAVKITHEAIFKLGVKRAESILRIDDRRDKPRTMEDKLKSIQKYIAQKG